MLYDPKWERDSLAGLRNWLAKQPADEVYHWYNCRDCVVGKYLEAHGVSHQEYSIWIQKVPGAATAAVACFATAEWSDPGTMGRALEKLDAWMAKNSVS